MSKFNKTRELTENEIEARDYANAECNRHEDLSWDHVYYEKLSELSEMDEYRNQQNSIDSLSDSKNKRQ